MVSYHCCSITDTWGVQTSDEWLQAHVWQEGPRGTVYGTQLPDGAQTGGLERAGFCHSSQRPGESRGNVPQPVTDQAHQGQFQYSTNHFCHWPAKHSTASRQATDKLKTVSPQAVTIEQLPPVEISGISWHFKSLLLIMEFSFFFLAYLFRFIICISVSSPVLLPSPSLCWALSGWVWLLLGLQHHWGPRGSAV